MTTARFAGSRSLDDRRRRRLATSPDTPVDFVAETTATVVPSTAVDSEPLESDAARNRTAPLAESAVPHVAWKTWLLVLGVGLLSAAAVAGGWLVERTPEFYGPELTALLGLSAGRVPQLVGSLLLFLSGQLAVAIWWSRSKSTRDFGGTYDVWLWAAGGWFVFALAHETEAHRAWSESIALLWEPDFWNKTNLSWLVPAVAVGAVLWMAARSDARRCRSSWTLLTLAGLCWFSAGVLTLGIGSRWIGPWQELVIAATVMAGHVLGFGGMLLHARFVNVVCNDPPVIKQAKPRARRRTARKPVTSPEKAGNPATPSATEPIESSPTTTEQDPSTVPSPVVAAVVPESVREPMPVDREVRTTVRASRRRQREEAEVVEPVSVESASTTSAPAEPVSGNAFTQDDGPPAEMLRGLSKRQKKRVRKEWRERQRNGIGDAA